MPSLKNEHTQFIDELSSTPIVNGYIYIGAANQDPEITPQTIYSDRALTVPLSNPQRTGADGRSLNKIHVAAEYSIRVRDSALVQKLSDLDSGPATVTSTEHQVIDKGVNYTTVLNNTGQIINATALITVSLGDAGTMGIGYAVTVKNSHTAGITVDLDTAADTLDGTVAGSQVIPPNAAATFAINADADGYVFASNAEQTALKAADIASAGALPTPSTNFADVTGTTSITSIDTSGVVGSTILRQFDASLTLTHHATDLILPGGADIQTMPGDIAEFVEYASGDWMLSNYYRSNWNTDGAYSLSIDGLDTALDTDTDHDVLINTGSCADSTGTVRMLLSTIITKQIDADWVEGDDFGGLSVGSRSVADIPNVSTWYHYFLISKTDGTVDAGWDTSLTATNLLADASTYTYYRRIASHFSNGSSNVSAYTQSGDSFLWTDPVLDMNNATVSSGGQSVTLTTPFGIKTNAYLYCTSTYTVDCDFLFNSLDQNSAVPGATNRIMHQDDPDDEFATAQVWIRTNTSSQIRTRGSVDGTVYVRTQGWNDPRID